jgi:ribosome-associated protein
MADDLQISRTHVLPGQSMTVKTARASGPGGQHVNKTETKVHLNFDPRAVPWIDEGTRLRIVALAGRNVDSDECVLITSQEHRDQLQNLEASREKLKQLVLKALVKPKRRVPTKPTKSSQRRRVDEKKRNAKTKATRGRVRDD